MVRNDKCYKCDKDAVGVYITTAGKRIPGCKKHFNKFPEDRRGLFSASLLKQRKSMSKLQKISSDHIIRNPALREIEQKLIRKIHSSNLICPACGDKDKGNIMNGRPYCFKCNVPLIDKSKIKKWFPIKPIKHKRYGLPEEQFRRKK
jgi:hypothetical protein